MPEIKAASEAQPELEARLSRLNREIDLLGESSHQIGVALNRLGVSDVPRDGAADEEKKEPQTFLERLDDALDRLYSIRGNDTDHATRCGYLV